MTQNVTIYPDQKVELSLLTWASENGRLRELWTYLCLRWEGRDSSGYVYRNKKPVGISDRHLHRMLKSLSDDLGWITLSKKSAKVKSLSKVLVEGNGMETLVESRTCVRIPCNITFEEFRATIFAAGICVLEKRQKYLLKVDPYYQELRKKGVVKRGMVSVSVLAEKLGVSRATAHRWKHRCAKLSLLTIIPEYLEWLSEAEALNRRAAGIRNIMRVKTPAGKYAWISRNTDILHSCVQMSSRWEHPKDKRKYREGYEPNIKPYRREKNSKSTIEINMSDADYEVLDNFLAALGMSCKPEKKKPVKKASPKASIIHHKAILDKNDLLYECF